MGQKDPTHWEEKVNPKKGVEKTLHFLTKFKKGGWKGINSSTSRDVKRRKKSKKHLKECRLTKEEELGGKGVVEKKKRSHGFHETFSLEGGKCSTRREKLRHGLKTGRRT